MSRAKEILHLAEGIVSGAMGFGKQYGGHLAVGGAAAGVGAQAAMAKHQRDKKIKDAGHGQNLQGAKDRLTLARVKSAKALGLSKKRRQAVQSAKANKKKVINKGLHSFAQKVASED
jgi:hypothetical protein